MGGDFFGLYSAQVADAAAGVFAGVAVEHFAPIAAVGNADAVSDARDGREVADDQDRVLRDSRFCVTSEIVLVALSLASTHSNPAGSLSSTCMAGSLR